MLIKYIGLMILMHTFANIITDSLKSITTTHNGRAGKLYKNDNRTYCDSVVTACENEKFTLT